MLVVLKLGTKVGVLRLIQCFWQLILPNEKRYGKKILFYIPYDGVYLINSDGSELVKIELKYLIVILSKAQCS